MEPVPTPQPAEAQKSSLKAPLLSPPLSPLTHSHIHHTQEVKGGLRVEAIGHCSTYQDPLALLPGIRGVLVLVQAKAHVIRILQLAIGELNCKVTAQE